MNKEVIKTVMVQTYGLQLTIETIATRPASWEEKPATLAFYFLLCGEAPERFEDPEIFQSLDLAGTKKHLHRNADTGLDLDEPGYVPVFQNFKAPAMMQFYRGKECLLLALESDETLARIWVVSFPDVWLLSVQR